MQRQVNTLQSVSHPDADSDAQARERENVDAEAIRVLMDALPQGLGAGFFGVACVAVLLHLLGVSAWLGVWVAAVSSLLSVCLVAYFRYRAGPRTPQQLHRWGRRFVWLASAAALAWGSAALFFLPGPPAVETLIILGVSSISVGGIGHMAAHLPVYLGFLLASEMPFVIALLRIGDTLHVGLAIGLTGMVVAVALFALQMNRSIKQSLRLAFRNRQLADALEVRTREAEQANLAKSRFLVAANHDLRQPVHAFGLLLEVLRGQGLNREQAKTLDQLIRSSEALDELFNGLLDVSKLDAGAVRPALRDVPLGALFTGLHREFEPLARAKSIDLRVRAAPWTVRSDPLLLERIVRNLLSNAIRYTGRGGVLLGLRRRGGQIAISIWDTGIGIAEHEHAAVFDEFYQCGNPERDRSRGLGLGLSIVQRLVRLLDHRLEMRSVPGHGSLFRIWVPAVARSVPEAIPLSASRLDGSLLAGYTVLVVEDDPNVSEATVGLLRMWGCEPTAFGSMDAVIRVVTDWPRAPDIVVCDLRLPNHGDGLALIAWLRDEFNCVIPALMMTGDTVLPPAREALCAEVVVLHKPVAPSAMLDALVALLDASGRQPTIERRGSAC